MRTSTGEMISTKTQVPKPKQIPNGKLQIPNRMPAVRLEFRALVFWICLSFGARHLELPFFCAPRKKTADVLSHVRRGLWVPACSHGSDWPEMRGLNKVSRADRKLAILSSSCVHDCLRTRQT